MQTFELHFNPKGKEDVIFESFCHEPENIYGKRLGNLYMVGELTHVLPQNIKLLEKLAQVLKKEYYTKLTRQQEESFRDSLKKANEFLAELTKKGNVSWLGNLNFVAMSIKGFVLNFSKVGNIKIYLLRDQNLVDIGNRLEFQEVEPYPLKIFTNIATGKLAPNDKIFILTSGAHDFFQEKGLIAKMAQATDEASLKEILNPYTKLLSEISGICLLMLVKERVQPKQSLAFPKRKISKIPAQISVEILRGFNKSLKILFNKFLVLLTRRWERVSKIKEIKLPKIALPSLPRPKFPQFQFKISFPRKKIFPVLILISILVLGFFIFQKERQAEFKKSQQILERVRAKTILAQNFLIFENEEQANLLLQEAWKEILPLTKIGVPLREEALNLKKSIEEKLAPFNKLEIIADPEIFFEFNPKEIDFFPQKFLLFDSKLYFFSPNSPKFYQFLPEEKKIKTLLAPRNLEFGIPLPDSILFFANPNILIRYFLGDQFQQITLPLLYPEFWADNLASFNSSLYFLDKKVGEIIKCLPPYSSPVLWLNPETKKVTDSKSMTIDGSIWILTKENQIDRYFGKTFQETLELNFFPFLENPTKIWTSPFHSYLYILEPELNRIIILTKTGKIVKQYQSDSFDNLLDFAISEDGKTIWLLNGLKVYQLNL